MVQPSRVRGARRFVGRSRGCVVRVGGVRRHNPNLSRTYGTRHRAAIGITEESDAIAIVVSEQRGCVSFCEGGRIVEDLDATGLTTYLETALTPRRESWWPFVRRGSPEKAPESRHV